MVLANYHASLNAIFSDRPRLVILLSRYPESIEEGVLNITSIAS